MKTTRRTFMGGTAALAAATAMPKFASAQEDSVLRVGLSNPVIPRTTGDASMGIEGRRFIDQTIYDPLMYYGARPWSDPNKLAPYLATSLTSDPANRRVWVMELRQGVKFHDGSDFDADSVIWNLASFFDQNSQQFMAQEAADVQGFVPKLTRWEKRGPFVIAVETAEPSPFMPYSFGALTMASPARFAEVGNWEAFALRPSGTGPFKLDSVDFKQGAELSRFEGYWDKNRVPRVAKMVYSPIFEANTRTTALVSGQVDWIEAVAPDTVDLIKSRGAKLVTNPYPQVWGYMLDCRPGSPYADIRVRKAVNLAVDRDGMANVMNGLMVPATGHYPKDHPWHGNPTFEIKYDPQQAKALLAEAGYGPDKRIKSKVLAVAGGSGMMQPPIMNAFVQSNLKEVGVDLEIDVVDWNGLWGSLSLGTDAPQSQGCDMFNFSLATHDPSEPLKEWGSRYFPPHGLNWGYSKSAKVDALVDKILASFDRDEQNKLYAEFNAAIVDEAFSLYVAHDAFPRAFGANVSGYVEGYNGIRVQDPSFITVG
jgi:ABC-type transport system substrate-binding protein